MTLLGKAMFKMNKKIPLSFRAFLFVCTFLSWITGIIFFVLDRFVIIEGEFGPVKHPLQYPTLQVHGGSAFIMMISFGALLSSHVPSGWKTKLHRRSGIALVSSQIFLVTSAYILYYGSGLLRDFAKYSHFVVGFFFPFIIALHVYSSIKIKKSKVKRTVLDNKKAYNTAT